jgi:hypothetical protein
MGCPSVSDTTQSGIVFILQKYHSGIDLGAKPNIHKQRFMVQRSEDRYLRSLASAGIVLAFSYVAPT